MDNEPVKPMNDGTLFYLGVLILVLLFLVGGVFSVVSLVFGALSFIFSGPGFAGVVMLCVWIWIKSSRKSPPNS